MHQCLHTLPCTASWGPTQLAILTELTPRTFNLKIAHSPCREGGWGPFALLLLTVTNQGLAYLHFRGTDAVVDKSPCLMLIDALLGP